MNELEKKEFNQDMQRYAVFKDVLKTFDKDYILPEHFEWMIKDVNFKGSILDIGAGFSIFPIVAYKRNPELAFTIQDASEFALFISCNLAELNKVPLEVFPAFNITEYPELNKEFDCIVMSNVLEHIPNTLETLKWLVTLLKEDGYIYIAVPYKDNHWDPHHVNYYGLASEEVTCQYNGNKILIRNILEDLKELKYIYKRLGIELESVIELKEKDIFIKISKSKESKRSKER